jgi:hypothetical protein
VPNQVRKRRLRHIVGAHFFSVRCRPGQGSYLLTLECGHYKSINASRLKGVGLPVTVVCRECEMEDTQARGTTEGSKRVR